MHRNVHVVTMWKLSSRAVNSQDNKCIITSLTKLFIGFIDFGQCLEYILSVWISSNSSEAEVDSA